MGHMYQMDKLVETCADVMIRSLTLKDVAKLTPLHKDERFPEKLWRQCEFVLFENLNEALANGDMLLAFAHAPAMANRIMKCMRVQTHVFE